MSRSAISTPAPVHGPHASTRYWLGLAGLLLLLVFLISLQLAPSVSDQRRDSGIFAYTGKIIHDGGLIYIDAWDNKLPGVYFIDAVAFALFGTNRWALWLIENFTLFSAALVLFWLLRQLYGERSEAWVGALILVLMTRHPGLINDTNYTEAYALLPQTVVFAAGFQLLRDPRARWAVLVGFAAAVALLIKQTTIGVALAFIPAVVLTRHPLARSPQRWRWLGLLVLGGLICLLPLIVGLLAYGILDEAIDASFVMSSSFHEWVGQESAWIGMTVINTFIDSPFLLVYGPLMPFLGLGIVSAWKRSRQRDDSSPQGRAVTTLSLWAILTLGTDLVLANITNRGYGHYYASLLPAATLLLVMAIRVLNEVGDHPAYDKTVKRARIYLVAILIGVPLGTSLVRFWQADWNIAGQARTPDLAEYVAAHTRPDDTVLVWGAATAINFLSGRASPTQFHYAYPLIVPEYTSEETIHELLLDLRTNQPAMIVDTTMIDGYRIPPLDLKMRRQWWAEGGRRDQANLVPIYNFVENNCRIVDRLDEVAIYRCYYPDPDLMPIKRHYAARQ